MIDQEQIKKEAEAIARGMGARIESFKFFRFRTGYVLRFCADYPQGGIGINDCAQINKKICRFLEESGIAGEDFTVEVDSPGLGCRLSGRNDFTKVGGRMVMLWLTEAIDGKSYYEGVIAEVTESTLGLNCGLKNVTIGFDKIKFGKEKVEF